MHKFSLLIILFFATLKVSFAQDTLPKITVTELGKKVLVSWNNPYTNATNINIQRSDDSTKGFTTIGSVLNVEPGINGFTDPKEFVPSNQYYRLFISFEGGTYIFTQSHRPVKDTLKAIKMEIVEKPVVKEVPKYFRNVFVPSKHVYTGKDNNVIIYLPDFAKNKYSIKFYEDNGNFLFELKKIPEAYLTLDKSNFRHAGLYIFEIYNNRIIVERHKFYIPKDGRPMPPLDAEGYEIR
ncbi:MAG TPA: hypothetical protein VFI29_03800 [Hanamia sp.]|nr:hypothetical protein [Hanamia sp.]